MNVAKGVSNIEELQTVTSFYKCDFHKLTLKVQLELFTTDFSQAEQSSQPTFCKVMKYVKSISPAMQSGMSEVMKLIELILIMPATNAVSECGTSALRRVKTYLHITIQQDCFNHLMILYIHKDTVDKLPLGRCVNEFNAHRSNSIAKF